MIQIYYLISTLRDEKYPVDLFLVENNKVKNLHINEIREGYYIKKNLTSSDQILFELEENEDLLDAIFSKDQHHSTFPNLKRTSYLKEASFLPGKYYARIHRPIINLKKGFSMGPNVEELEKEVRGYREFLPCNSQELISSINQLSVLSHHLTLLFQTVQPNRINYKVFGHSIRNLLILTCTEVEAQLKGIIKSVSRSYDEKKRYSTNDYIKLCDKLKLKEYTVSLGYYPLEDKLEPFKSWDGSKPTKSIEWYDNYNAVKHDREDEFPRATLWSTIQAIAGLAILIKAQYGENLPYWKEQIGGFFVFETTPNWEITDKYLPPFLDEEWENDYLDF